MRNLKDEVDKASDDSFPASDPPSFTPVTGAGDPHSENKVVEADGLLVVHVPNGQGEELRQRLEAHGYTANVVLANGPDRIEIDATTAEIEDLQSIVDQWDE